MMRRRLATVGLAVSAVLAAGSAWAMVEQLGPGEGQVSIVAWPGYIERGETDKAFDWVTGFEAATGCKVSVKTAGTSDEMVALMNEGGFDLVTASGDASLRLIAGKKVQEINPALIPSWGTVDERLQNAPWHTVDGRHYGAPYQWGPNVLMYNTEAFQGQTPTSWNVVFEEQVLPDGKPNKGRIQAFDGPIHIADAANYLRHHRPELGIKDPYELNEDQYQAALDLLRQQRAIVHRYWHDAFVQIDDFTNEGVVASGSWPFQVNLLKSKGAPIASTIPIEGATGWADTTMMHAESENPNCAYLWLEHSLSPKVQGDLAAWFGSVPAVPAACQGNALLTDQGCAANGFDNFEKIAFWRTPVAKCATQEAGCVPYYRWVTDYIAILGGRGGALLTSAIEFRGVSRSFGEVRAVDQVSFEIADGEFFAMLGPSGSGKTTCLRLIAGFDEPDAGEIVLHGRPMRGVPPYDRPVNTVFQDYALFPHMNVLDNVAYGMMVRGVAKAARYAKAERMLEVVALGGFGARRPSQLSGGQRQRVALARALVLEPEVLLLDEPLGALDLKLRQQMQGELKALQRKVGITFVFVTHDQDEALGMADRVAVFNGGRIEQIGTAEEVYEHPATAFVAGFVGSANIVDAATAERLIGHAEAFSLRPERIGIDSAGDVAVEGTVVAVHYHGASTRLEVAVDAGPVLAVDRPNDGQVQRRASGERVRLVWPRSAMRRLREPAA